MGCELYHCGLTGPLVGLVVPSVDVGRVDHDVPLTDRPRLTVGGLEAQLAMRYDDVVYSLPQSMMSITLQVWTRRTKCIGIMHHANMVRLHI